MRPTGAALYQEPDRADGGPSALLARIKKSEQWVSPSGLPTESRNQPGHERVRTQGLPVGRRSQVLDINLVGAVTVTLDASMRFVAGVAHPRGARTTCFRPRAGRSGATKNGSRPLGRAPLGIGAAIRRDHRRGNAEGRMKEETDSRTARATRPPAPRIRFRDEHPATARNALVRQRRPATGPVHENNACGGRPPVGGHDTGPRQRPSTNMTRIVSRAGFDQNTGRDVAAGCPAGRSPRPGRRPSREHVTQPPPIVPGHRLTSTPDPAPPRRAGGRRSGQRIPRRGSGRAQRCSTVQPTDTVRQAGATLNAIGFQPETRMDEKTLQTTYEGDTTWDASAPRAGRACRDRGRARTACRGSTGRSPTSRR